MVMTSFSVCCLSLFCYDPCMRHTWTVEFLNEQVEREFYEIPKDLQARLVRITDLIESHGLEHLGMPYVRHLQGKLWEIRGKAAAGIARALYSNRCWQESGYSAGLCEKKPEDAVSRNRFGVVTNNGD